MPYPPPYTNWGYKPNFIPVPWDFTSDFEDGQDAFLAQWWDPRYNGGVSIYPAYSFYCIGVRPLATVIADVTAPSGLHSLHLEAWAPAPNPYNRVYCGGMHYESTRPDRVEISFYWKIDSAQWTQPSGIRNLAIFWDSLTNVELTYENNAGQDEYTLDFPDGVQTTFARVDDWQHFYFQADLLTGAWTLTVDGVVSRSETELGWGDAYIDPEHEYFGLGGGLLTTTFAEIASAMTVNWYLDDLRIRLWQDDVEWTCDCESARFESQFGFWAAEDAFGNRPDFAATVTEGDNTFLRIDAVDKLVEKGFQIYPCNDLSFDVRMPDAAEEDLAVFWFPYSVSIENYHDVAAYDYATLIYIYYDHVTDRFRLDTSQYGDDTLIYPYMGEAVDVSWPRPTDWQTIRCVWNYAARQFTLLVDDVEMASYTVQSFEDLTEWTDMWGSTFYPTGTNWVGLLYPQWGDVFVGALGAFRRAALVDLDNFRWVGSMSCTPLVQTYLPVTFATGYRSIRPTISMFRPQIGS